MKEQIKYANKNGVEFVIEIKKSDVPKEANYWLFNLKVTEHSTELTKIYPAMIKRDFCPNDSSAADSVKGTPIKVLKSALDEYQDGSTPIKMTETDDHWVILT